jgi:hypothetical protein
VEAVLELREIFHEFNDLDNMTKIKVVQVRLRGMNMILYPRKNFHHQLTCLSVVSAKQFQLQDELLHDFEPKELP